MVGQDDREQQGKAVIVGIYSYAWITQILLQGIVVESPLQGGELTNPS